MLQVAERTTLRRRRLSIVGRALLLALHTKFFTLLGTHSFHKPLQKFFWGLGLELLALLVEAVETGNLYALWVLKQPEEEGDQIKRSCGSRMLKGMLKISSASWGKKLWLIRSALHDPMLASIRLLTLASGGMEGMGELTFLNTSSGSHLSSLMQTD